MTITSVSMQDYVAKQFIDLSHLCRISTCLTFLAGVLAFGTSESLAQTPYPAPRTELTIKPSYPMREAEEIATHYDRSLGNRATLRTRPRSSGLSMDRAPAPRAASVDMSVRSYPLDNETPSQQQQVKHYSRTYETPSAPQAVYQPYQRQPVPAPVPSPPQGVNTRYPASQSVALQPQQPYQTQPVPVYQPPQTVPQQVQPTPVIQPQPSVAYQPPAQAPMDIQVTEAPFPVEKAEQEEPSFWERLFTPSAQEELNTIDTTETTVSPTESYTEIENYTDSPTPVDTAPVFTQTDIAQAQEVPPEPTIRYYDATAEAGTAPSFADEETDDISISPAQSLDAFVAEQPVSEAAPAIEVAAEPVQELSTETKQILDKLPTDLFPNQRGVQGGFDISRSNPQTALPDETFESDASIGADIAIRRQSIDVNYELEKAYNALLQGHTEMAIAIYKDILSAEPNNKHALFGLATTYHRLNLLPEARLFYGKLIEIDPYNREALNNFLGLVGQEAPESAILYLEQLKDRNRDFSPIYAQLAQLYSAAGNTEQAIINMQQATAISPDNLIYLYNLGVLYDMHGDAARASVIYQQLIRAGLDGKEIPASLDDLQERLTFLSSNN